MCQSHEDYKRMKEKLRLKLSKKNPYFIFFMEGYYLLQLYQLLDRF